ncbi:MAG: glycosyltransferase family 9 protein [Bryobacterales bacterium]|jgi:hypothetical protein|nr:glycosyltransferase family 9 protein [Bryobacterales bacterium]
MRRLLIRPGAIGDCLCALPALYALRADETEIWTNGAVAPLIPFATRVRSLAGTGFDLLGIPDAQPPAELLATLRHFDEVLSWAGFSQPLLRQRITQLPTRFHFFHALPAPQESGHVTDWMFQQTRTWHGLQVEPHANASPGGRRFLLPQFAISAAPLVSRPLVILHPYSGSPAKNWPLTYFRELATRLQPLCDIRWCASPEDPLPADLSPDAWRHNRLDHLAQHLATAHLYVGNDSGITHLAAMLGIPTVVFFGPMSPSRWLPRGSRVYPVCAPQPGLPAAAIPFDAGLHAAQAALQEIGIPA